MRQFPMTFLVLLLALNVTVNCNDAGFKGGSDTKKKNNDDNAAQDKPNRDARTPADNENSLNSGDDKDTNKVGGGGDCSTANPFDYNIVLIFDNSGSQLENDPQLIRAQGARLFVEQLSSLQNSDNQAIFNVAIIKFSNSAEVISNWRKVDNGSIQGLNSAIQQATQSPNGATEYLGALNMATDLLSNKRAKADKNFVVFVTDGQPTVLNGQHVYDISPHRPPVLDAVNRLVATVNAAVITVAAGQAATVPGAAQLLQEMALPKQNSQDQNHIGASFVAQTADALRSIWSKIFQEIVVCN